MPGDVHPLDAGGLKLPHIGWNVVTFSRPGSPLLDGLPDRCAFYHVHSFAPVPGARSGRARAGRVRRPLRQRGRTATLLRRPVSPREVLRRRASACSPTSPRICLAARGLAVAAVMLYPAIDILDGNAVRLVKGDFDAKKVYDEDPLSAARALGRGGRGALHVVDLDGAREGDRSTSTTCADHLASSTSRSSTAAACAPASGRASPARRRHAGDPRHRRLHRPRAPREALAAHGPERCSSRWTRAAGTSPPPAGPRRRPV